MSMEAQTEQIHIIHVMWLSLGLILPEHNYSVKLQMIKQVPAFTYIPVH